MDKKEEPQKPVEEVDDDDDEEEEDLFNKRIENSGCSKQHYELQVKNQILPFQRCEICQNSFICYNNDIKIKKTVRTFFESDFRLKNK